MSEIKNFVTPSVAARRLGVSVELVRVWLRTGRLQHTRTPLGRLIPVEEVERLAAQRQKGSVSP